jgi:hypothetical protein
MSHSSQPRPRGHVILPVLATGSLGMIVAFGLDALRMLDGINHRFADWIRAAGVDGLVNRLPGWMVWSATAVIAYGLALVILEVPGLWRRVVLWITTLVMVLAWAPVLGLAAHEPAIGGPLVASIWSGVCALVYAHRHRMAVDESPPDPTHGPG